MNHSYFLYAEDDQDEIDLLNEIFSVDECPSDIVSVSNGFDLLNYLQKIRKGQSYPNLIILDKLMPRLNGLETLKLLKTDDIYRLIPVVLFSAEYSESEMAICQSLGAEALLKPSEYANWNRVKNQMCNYIDE
jgi:CheY-like chemotaxis protein